MMKPHDLERFDTWALKRGFTDPRAYSAACEVWEKLQAEIDELAAAVKRGKVVPIEMGRDSKGRFTSGS